MIRVLPDTNIIISSVFWRGNPYEVIRRGILGEYQLVISAEILDELRLNYKLFPAKSQTNGIQNRLGKWVYVSLASVENRKQMSLR